MTEVKNTELNRNELRENELNTVTGGGSWEGRLTRRIDKVLRHFGINLRKTAAEEEETPETPARPDPAALKAPGNVRVPLSGPVTLPDTEEEEN